MSFTPEMDIPCELKVCKIAAVPLEKFIEQYGFPDGRVIYRGFVLLDVEELIELAKSREPAKPTVGRAARVAVRKPTGDKPPCIALIEERIARGEEVEHMARFALVTWYSAVYGVNDDTVKRLVDIFSKSPDFNPKVTEYQIRHIMGQVGGRKTYSTPSCDTMYTNGLCPTAKSCGIKNIIQYGRRERLVIKVHERS